MKSPGDHHGGRLSAGLGSYYDATRLLQGTQARRAVVVSRATILQAPGETSETASEAHQEGAMDAEHARQDGHGARTVSDEERLIIAGYEEARRRDALGVHDKWHWKLMALGLLMYCGLVTGLALWLGLRPPVIDAPVQLVQVNQGGQVEPLGPPQALLAYTPEEAQWMEMLAQWVMKRRWKGGDAPVAAEQLGWVVMHTCKPAIEDVQRWEREEKPLEVGKRRVQVEVTAVTKTEAPKAYNVLWKEWVTEGNQPPKEERWAGTFTVGRIKVSTPPMVLHNRLGLCVTAYSWSRQPS